MKIQTIKIDDLKPYENNPRFNDDAVEEVANSIKQFGFKVPIVIDKNNVIVAGHTRYKACLELGIKEVPCVIADDLTDEQIKAFRLADNKVSEKSTWDIDLLQEELDDIINIDMSEFGFIFDFDDDEDEQEIIEDEVPDVPKKPKSKLGDIYQLGNHRLMCGNSTLEQDVMKLMNNEKADITFTSPPYNTNASNGGGYTNINGKKSNYYNKNDGIYRGSLKDNDNKSEEEYANLLIKSCNNALKVSDDVLFNIGILAGSKKGLLDFLYNKKENFNDIIIWNKSNSIPLGLPSNKHQVSHRCELIFCFNNDGNRNFNHSQWETGTQINRIDTNNASQNQYKKYNGATFPLELPYNVLKDYTENSVLDLFGGTGTTMIAAEQLGKKCYMMELDPLFCDVIIERWENFTGKKAIKLN